MLYSKIEKKYQELYKDEQRKIINIKRSASLHPVYSITN